MYYLENAEYLIVLLDYFCLSKSYLQEYKNIYIEFIILRILGCISITLTSHFWNTLTIFMSSYSLHSPTSVLLDFGLN
jgi:hypothetical protein